MITQTDTINKRLRFATIDAMIRRVNEIIGNIETHPDMFSKMPLHLCTYMRCDVCKKVLCSDEMFCGDGTVYRLANRVVEARSANDYFLTMSILALLLEELNILQNAEVRVRGDFYDNTK